MTPNPIAASAANSAASPAPPVVYGLLQTSKTITLTFIPDWNQKDLGIPFRAATLLLLLGPKGTLPQKASWKIEFNVFAEDKMPSSDLGKNEARIAKDQRAILWYDGKPFPTYKTCMTLSNCWLSHNAIKTHSITVRAHEKERCPNALVWVYKYVGLNRRKDLSYLKVISGHHYKINITFAPGSNILQLLCEGGSQAWRPSMYLYAKRQKKGIDEILSCRQFTNFVTHMADEVEPNVDMPELKKAAEALQREAEEDAEYRHENAIGAQSGSHVDGSRYVRQNFDVSNTITEKHLFPVDDRQINSAISVFPRIGVEKFLKPGDSTLAYALSAIESKARMMAADIKSPHQDMAKQLLNCFYAMSQLPCWHLLQTYIQDSKSFAWKATANGGVEDLKIKAQGIIRHLGQRVDWLLECERKTEKEFDPEFYLKVIAADKILAEKMNELIRKTEAFVEDVQTKHYEAFSTFRALHQKTMIEWLHSIELLVEIEKAGWKFRPTMLKRDRCICETCGAEFFGWMPWHNAWGPHNYAKHTPSFRPDDSIRLCFPDPMLNHAITESNKSPK